MADIEYAAGDEVVLKDGGLSGIVISKGRIKGIEGPVYVIQLVFNNRRIPCLADELDPFVSVRSLPDEELSDILRRGRAPQAVLDGVLAEQNRRKRRHEQAAARALRRQKLLAKEQ